jgi:hypothetical protein
MDVSVIIPQKHISFAVSSNSDDFAQYFIPGGLELEGAIAL